VPDAKTPSIAFIAVLALAVACTDPRARPVSPTVQITLTPRTVVASPGPLTGSLDVYDPNGIDSIRVSLELGNGSTVADSTFFPSGTDPFEVMLPLLFQLPGALPARTSVRIVARARSFIGFAAADTLVTAVGDTL
jgi:hypothetical protein